MEFVVSLLEKNIKSPFGSHIIKKSTLTLCVFDVIMRVTDRLDEQTITFDTVELLLKHVSYYVRTANFSKKANTLVEKKFFEKIMTRLAIIVGDVGKI